MEDLKISGLLDLPTVGTELGSNRNDGVNFADAMNKAMENTVAALKDGEVTAVGAISDEVSLDQLAISIANAEMSLRTVVAIRDRIITAYQDIIKMPI